MTTNQEASAAVVEWLDAEAAADDAGSEMALRRLLGALPKPAPPTNFGEQVLTAGVRDGIMPAPTRSWSGRPARVLVWALVVIAGTVGLAVALGPLVLRQLARLLNFSVQGFVWIVGGLERGLDAWSLLVELGRAVGATLATPQVSISVVMIELVGVAALYALLRVLSLDRESTR